MSEGSKQRARERKYDKEPKVPVLTSDPCVKMAHALTMLVLAVDDFMITLEDHANKHGLDITNFPKNDELQQACERAWRMREE